MNNGLITGNSSLSGAGLFVWNNAIVNINGGLITNNEARSQGGGIYIDYERSTGKNIMVTMTGGIISRNKAIQHDGGAIFFHTGFARDVPCFRKIATEGRTTSGIIYGSDAASTLANTAGRSGAVISNWNKSRNRTLGETDEISTATSIGWGQ
jgi:hypothetical protein